MAGEGSSLRITTECYTCYHWLPRALRELRRRLPRLQLEIVPEATYHALDALRDREVDVAITCLPSPAASAAVLEEEDGLLAGMAPGKIWLEMSTTDEAEVRRRVRSTAGGGAIRAGGR